MLENNNLFYTAQNSVKRNNIETFCLYMFIHGAICDND